MYRLLLFSVFLAMFATPASASWEQSSQQREQQVLDQLQKVAPAQTETFKAATAAWLAENYGEAARLYGEVLRMAPDFDPAMRRRGECLVFDGKHEEGFAFLEKAVQKNRSPENLFALARSLVLSKSEGPEARNLQYRALALITEILDSPQPKLDEETYYVAQAQLALQLDKTMVFRAATAKLAAMAPDDKRTHYFLAIQAAMDSQWFVAEEEIQKAANRGLDPETVEYFLAAGVRSRARVWHFVYYSLGLTLIWVLGIVGLFLIGKFMSRATLQSIENSDPNRAANGSELRLRKLYRLLINVGGVYYYISIPIVMFLVLALAASITYAFLLLGRIPIKLLAIVIICALVTVYKMARSFFLRVEREEPGRSLSRDEAPELWALTRKVGLTLRTRPIDEIRVTPGTDVAVYERGTYRERANNKSKRVLLLGVGVLDGFNLNAFRAVLAHEYGHFSNRDTAGGEVAFRVKEHMGKFAYAMYESEQAVWWNIAFLFLRVYHFIFRRLSHGATRLQEVLADRVAAVKYGALAFEDGLKHVIRKSAEFEFLATKEINESANASRALNNLYELSNTDNSNINDEIQNQLTRQTTEDDTHPSPEDRFRLVRKITSASEQPLAGEVWDLFKDRAGLTTEMTKRIEQGLY